MKPVFNKYSTFSLQQGTTNDNDKVTFLASKKAQQILKGNEPLQLAKLDDNNGSILHLTNNNNTTNFQQSSQQPQKSNLHQLPPLISLLMHIFISLIKGTNLMSNQIIDSTTKQQLSDKLGFGLFGNVLTQHIKVPLLRLIANVIEKKLYKHVGGNNGMTAQQHHLFGRYQQISYSVIFKNCLLSVFLSIVSQNSSSLIGVDKLINLHKHLMAENYILYVPIYLYFMYGGGLFTIERKIFKNSFVKLINNLSFVLTKQQTIITRNVQEIKKKKHQQQILTQSLNIVCSATNKDYLNQIAQRLCFLLFGDREYIKKEEFCQRVVGMDDGEKTKEYLLFYVNLLRVEMQVVSDGSVKKGKGVSLEGNTKGMMRSNDMNSQQQQQEKQQKSPNTTSPSFYATQMQKILKKCPYNGDKKCDCKKCQCVRRNRQSAKLSQQKKRNAVQQIQPMRQRILSLQAQNKQLIEENMILKQLLSTTLKNNPQFKSMLMGTIEPMSKILRDN